MREEVYPLEVLETDDQGFMRAIRPLQEEVKRQKLWATHLPPDLGGQGYGQVKLGLMHEIEGASVWGPIVFGNQAPDSGNSEVLAVFGNEAQKKQWLHPLLAGKLRSAFSMTEPNTSGSDPTLLSTTAELRGDEWVINGHKWFTSNGMIADFFIVMVVTDPDEGPYVRASMILVPGDTPGVNRLRNIPTLSGEHDKFGYGHAEIKYENVRVPKENLIGQRGQGFLIAQSRLGPGRIHHCMRWLGQSRRAFDMMCERAVSRYTHGSHLSEKQTIQNWVADSLAEMTAARLMTLHAAWTMDVSGPSAARVEIAMIKYYGAQVLYNVIDRAIQVHGSLGFSTDLPLEHMYRAARAARIYDGPDEVHRVTVARQVLKGYKPVEVPTEHVPTRREDATRRFAKYLDRATADL
jgi:acyl-CoA dehydrogenase